MSDLVGHPENRFSHGTAHMVSPTFYIHFFSRNSRWLKSRESNASGSMIGGEHFYYSRGHISSEAGITAGLKRMFVSFLVSKVDLLCYLLIYIYHSALEIYCAWSIYSYRQKHI